MAALYLACRHISECATWWPRHCHINKHNNNNESNETQLHCDQGFDGLARLQPTNPWFTLCVSVVQWGHKTLLPMSSSSANERQADTCIGVHNVYMYLLKHMWCRCVYTNLLGRVYPYRPHKLLGKRMTYMIRIQHSIYDARMDFLWCSYNEWIPK